MPGAGVEAYYMRLSMSISSRLRLCLLQNLCHYSVADGLTPVSQREALAGLQGNVVLESEREFRVVSRHHHFNT